MSTIQQPVTEPYSLQAFYNFAIRNSLACALPTASNKELAAELSRIKHDKDFGALNPRNIFFFVQMFNGRSLRLYVNSKFSLDEKKTGNLLQPFGATLVGDEGVADALENIIFIDSPQLLCKTLLHIPINDIQGSEQRVEIARLCILIAQSIISKHQWISDTDETFRNNISESLTDAMQSDGMDDPVKRFHASHTKIAISSYIASYVLRSYEQKEPTLLESVCQLLAMGGYLLKSAKQNEFTKHLLCEQDDNMLQICPSFKQYLGQVPGHLR